MSKRNSFYKERNKQTSPEEKTSRKFYPLISIVMPNYNGERFVKQSILSVQKQTYTNFELIIIDDASTDQSPEIISSLAESDKRIVFLKQKENSGVATVRNIGIQMAKGAYIALLDNDDTWEPDKLERQLRIAEDGAAIVYCSYDFIDEDGYFIKKPFLVPEKATYKSMLTSSVISCSSAFIKTDLLKAHPFNTDYYHEDYVLWMELLKLPVVAIGDRKILMHYRQVARSRSNKKSNAARERWNTYRNALGLNIIQSVSAFTGYAINGIIKYYL